jgi:hypothetical protein
VLIILPEKVVKIVKRVAGTSQAGRGKEGGMGVNMMEIHYI